MIILQRVSEDEMDGGLGLDRGGFGSCGIGVLDVGCRHVK